MKTSTPSSQLILATECQNAPRSSRTTAVKHRSRFNNNKQTESDGRRPSVGQAMQPAGARQAPSAALPQQQLEKTAQ